MKPLQFRLFAAMAAWAASNDTFVTATLDVYPVTGAEVKGVSVLVQDGKIATSARRSWRPKACAWFDAKGFLRCTGVMIDSGTNWGGGD